MPIDPKAREAVERGYAVQDFLRGQGGVYVHNVIKELLEEHVSALGSAEREHSTDFHAGAVTALRDLLLKVHGVAAMGDWLHHAAGAMARSEAIQRIQALKRKQTDAQPRRGHGGNSPL